MDELLDTWIDQGPTVAPSRIAEATRVLIRTTNQRRATWWPVRRPMTMNSTLRYVVAAAVVTLAALVGFTFLNNQIGTEPTPSPNASDSASGLLPAGLNHPFIGEPRSIPGLAGDPGAAILNFDGTTFRFDSGQRDIFISEAAVTESGQLILTTVSTRDGCKAGDEGLYDFSFSPGDSYMTITGADDCAARLAALVGTWQRSDCENPDNFCLGNLEAGSYSSQYFEPRPQGAWAPRFGALTFTVPEGWAATYDYPEHYFLETQASYAAGTPGADGCSNCPDGIGVWAAPMAAARDCSEAAAPGVGTSAAEIAEWVGQVPGIVTTQSSATIDGRSGIVLDVEGREGRVGTCGEAGVPLFYGGWQIAVAAGDRQRMILVDLGGGDTALIVIDTADPADFEALAAEAMPIVETFAFPPR